MPVSQVKRANPEKNCFLEYDRLYVDHKIFVYNDAMGQVVELSEAQRYSELMSRPGTQVGKTGLSDVYFLTDFFLPKMMMYPGGGGSGRDSAMVGFVDAPGGGYDPRYLGPSRPPSGMSTRGYVRINDS